MVFKRARSPFWYYRFMMNGTSVYECTKQGNKGTAEALEAAHRTRLAKGEAGLQTGDAPSFEQFSKRFLDAIKKRSETTHKFYASKIKPLLTYAPLASARVDRIDESLIERWVARRSEDAVTPASINRELATLRRALRLAQEWKLINRVPRIRLLAGERNREFVLSREQEPVYLAACPQPLKDAAALILETGLRVGEALNLRWSDVELQPGEGKKLGYVLIRKGKTKNAVRAVSLTPRATALLAARKASAVNDLVFPGDSIERPFVGTSLAHQHERVRELLGLDGEFVIHSLRHTALTRLGAAGVDAFTIMRIAGHSSVTVSQRYIHPSAEAMESAFEKLGLVGAQPKSGARKKTAKAA
jgi:integrase